MLDKKREFYKAKELAELLGYNVVTIYRYINAGKLRAHKIGKEFRVSRRDYGHFMKSRITK